MRHLGWQNALMNGIVVSGVVLGWVTCAPGEARPIADDTLGAERSRVVPLDPTVPVDRIDGGARRGNNLFHSFREFNVDQGRSVFFTDPGVRNIFSRVTGGSESQILGALGVQGSANLFLINPNGIIFGSNARLDVRGSFTATTANAIQFGDQGFFSATNPTAPALLTVQPSAFLFNQINPAPIVNNSVAAAAPNPSGALGIGLRVPAGSSLTLLGGNVSSNRGGMNAVGGRIEIGGLSQPGTVVLNSDDSLSFPSGVARAEVSLRNPRIDVAAGGGGTITINAGNLEILGDSSRLFAGIGFRSGFVGAQAGDITLNADTIRLGGGAVIDNGVRALSVGNSGNIRITTNSLSLTEGSRLRSIGIGQGNVGSIIIHARDRISIDGVNPNNNEVSGIFSTIGVTTVVGGPGVIAFFAGNSGDIRITTGFLSLTNRGQLVTSTLGKGNAGNVIIDARDDVSLDNRSAILSAVGDVNLAVTAVGNGGDIRINASSFSLTNGAQLIVSTRGIGNAGNVIINARDRVSLDGINPIGNTASTIFSNVGDFTLDRVAVGNGGDIRITAGSFSLTDGAQIVASTVAKGNAGNVMIEARDTVTLDNSSIFSAVGNTGSKVIAVGNGGDIRITTGSLTLTNDAQLFASTLGKGNAGNVIIDANNDVALDNRSAISSAVGSIDSATTAVGNGGDIRIATSSFSLKNGSRLSANTFAEGNAGNVTVDARDGITLDNQSGISSAVSDVNSATTAVGNGGDIRIAADSFSLKNGSQLSASTFGQGNAGKVIVAAHDARFPVEGVNRQMELPVENLYRYT